MFDGLFYPFADDDLPLVKTAAAAHRMPTRR